MSTHKHIDRICVVITVLALLVTILFMNGRALGVTVLPRGMGYENTLFDTSRVHTIDIVIDDWDAFLQTAASEEYAVCSLVIDNESVKNVAIRGKGNTSLSTVATMGSLRYSFKIEFDHYEDGKTYRGLDKLCLNNLIQDNTYMKDYLAYRLMDEFGADAPLCSYVQVTVNGEDWGLYLAVESVEDSFLSRVYGGEGELYKPDSLSMGGGGPGNGRDFNIEDFMNENADLMGIPWNRGEDSGEESSSDGVLPESGSFPQFSGEDGAWPEMPDPDEEGEQSARPSFGGFGGFSGSGDFGDGSERPEMPGGMDFSGGMNFFGGGGMGMGSQDVKLQYIDDDPDSYSNIFDNAKTLVSTADQTRLIRSLKSLSEGEDLESVLDVDELLRYFVVHNYLVNSDSYTGSMVHNYYLHESDGKLSMIPWDYNLAFGTFQGGGASGAVNDPIDSPLSVSGDGTRPMADWIFQSEEYTELYHRYFAQFLDEIDILAMIDETYELIAPYVEKDPTAFCSYEEFETGVSTLRSFCEKRTESVRGQLDGTIPSTDDGQTADSSALIDASGLNLSDMGSMGGGFGGRGGNGSFGPGSSSGGDAGSGEAFSLPEGDSDWGEMPSFGGGFQFPEGEDGEFQMPDMDSGEFQMPDMDSGEFQPPSFGGNGGFQPPSSGNGGGSQMPSFGGNGSFQPPSSGNGGGSQPSGPQNGGGSAAGKTGGMPASGFSSRSAGGGTPWTELIVTAVVLAAGLAAVILYGRKQRV